MITALEKISCFVQKTQDGFQNKIIVFDKIWFQLGPFLTDSWQDVEHDRRWDDVRNGE